MYYSATLVINIIVIIAMLTFSGIGRLVFKKNAAASAFSFGNPQKIATIAYCVAVGSLAAIPAFASGKDYLQDMQNEKYKTHIKSIVKTNNKKDFETALEENKNLAELRLDYTTQSLLEYLLVKNKTQLVDISIKHNQGCVGL